MDNILTRRSIRKYTEEPVSEAETRKLLEAAMSAPSAANQQPWHFVVINDREILNKIPEILQYGQMSCEASMVIVVCLDDELEKHKGFGAQDCSAATENILLAANAMGLGAVWCGVYPKEERMNPTGEMLGLPENVHPFSLIAIGHPGEEKEKADRYSEDRVHYDKW